MEFAHEIVYFKNCNKNHKTENWIKHNKPNFYNYLIFSYPNIKFNQKLYHFLYNITVLPCCKKCSSTVKFSFTRGYNKYCSLSCAAQSKEKQENIKKTCLKKYGYTSASKSKHVKQKMIQTCLKKYGVEYSFQSVKVKNKIKTKSKNSIIKRKKTCLKKYGVDNPTKNKHVKEKMSKSLKSDICRKKFADTCYLRFGTDHHLKSTKIKNLIKQTNIKKYGVSCTLQSAQIKERVKNKHLEKFNYKIKKDVNIIVADYNSKQIVYKCPKCNKESTLHYSFYYNRKIKYKMTVCLYCAPLHRQHSNDELQLYNFILQHYDKDVVQRNTSVIKKELDILLKDLNLAFEYNGVYWHSDEFKSEHYHLNKTNLALEKGIRLIHVWEDDWHFKQEIVKSKILNLLDKNVNTIHARKCEIKEINTKQARIFINENHLQEYRNSSIKIGLFYESALVSLMTFGKNCKTDHYELYRFCSKLNLHIVDGASKILKYFVKTYQPKSIVSYFDRSWGTSVLCNIIEFQLLNIDTDYWYVVDGIRAQHSNYQKLNYKRIFGPGVEKWNIIFE